MSEQRQVITVRDYIPEFIDELERQLESDHKRWGNTWLNRPKEGQELRTKARYKDYFDMFENAGTPVPWMKIVGGALICWIRDNHPELCIDANECEDEGKLELIGIKVSPDGVEDIKIVSPDNPNSSAGIFGSFTHPGDEKPVEEMTTKELIESTVPTVQHKSDCAIYNEPPAGFASSVSECDCQDCNLPDLKDIVDPTSLDGKAGKEFGKAVQETTDKVLVETLKGRQQSNPVAHVRGEVLENWNKGVLAYSPRNSNDGKIIRESVIFTTGSMGREIVLAKCDRDGFIARGSGNHWVEGTLDTNGKYVITECCGFDSRVKYTLFVSYDYEYALPME